MNYNKFDIELRHLLDYMNDRNYSPHNIVHTDGELELWTENKKFHSHNPLIEQAISIIKSHGIVTLDFIDKQNRIYSIDIILGNAPGKIVHDCYWNNDYKDEWGRFYNTLCRASEEFEIWTDFNDRYCSNVGIGYALGMDMEEASKLA